MGFFLCTLLIRYMLFKVRKNHNHGPNSIWVGSRAIWGLCFVGIINNKIGYLAAILGFICVDEVLVRRLDGIKEKGGFLDDYNNE